MFLQDLYRSILKDAGTSSDIKFTSIALSNFLAGAAAGCTTLVLIYPLDIAHTRLAADIGRTDTRQFRGIRHFIQTIYKTNGIRGIYRGLPASLQGMVSPCAIEGFLQRFLDSIWGVVLGQSFREQQLEHFVPGCWFPPAY